MTVGIVSRLHHLRKMLRYGQDRDMCKGDSVSVILQYYDL